MQIARVKISDLGKFVPIVDRNHAFASRNEPVGFELHQRSIDVYGGQRHRVAEAQERRSVEDYLNARYHLFLR